MPVFCLDGPKEIAFKAMAWRCPVFSRDRREVLIENALVPIVAVKDTTAIIAATETIRRHILLTILFQAINWWVENDKQRWEARDSNYVARIFSIDFRFASDFARFM